MNENASEVGNFTKEKFEFAGEQVLKDIDYGFFIYAYADDGKE